MDYYKYWLLKNIQHLDIDILFSIKQYCQIEFYYPPSFKELSSVNSYTELINSNYICKELQIGIFNDTYKLINSSFEVKNGIIVQVKYHYRSKDFYHEFSLCFSVICPNFFSVYKYTLPIWYNDIELLKLPDVLPKGVYIVKGPITFVCNA